MELNLDDVKSEDRGILGPCGIVCLGCDLHKGESLEAAKIVVKIWEGFNLPDVAKAFGLEPEDVVRTLETLKEYIRISEESGPCSGCHIGGLGHCAICPIVNCAKSKGYWTCAECENYSPELEYPCPHMNSVSTPFESRGAMFAMVCKRYNVNNLENLKRCREIGYHAFIAEIKEKTENGWRTWQVISREMLLQGKTMESLF
ncbi:MAG: DUF3795 domain-containing protein [Deltaproteobacteria bacterium]|nr:DUF3795 domain-containing protein [Deltaproteobacteria bacterium]